MGSVDSVTRNASEQVENKKVDVSEEKPKHALDVLVSFFEKSVLAFANQIKQEREPLASELKYILELIQGEIEIFSDYLKDKVKVDDYTSLTAKEKIILSLFRLHNEGFRGLQVMSIARAMAIEYGGDKETYRKIIKEINNNGFGSQEPENIESMIKCIQRGTSKSNMDKGDEMYKYIKNFNLQSLRELLKKIKYIKTKNVGEAEMLLLFLCLYMCVLTFFGVPPKMDFREKKTVLCCIAFKVHHESIFNNENKRIMGKIILTNVEELRELINAAVVNAFENAKSAEKRKAIAEEYLTRDQVCDILKISMSSLTRRVADGSLKCYKNGARSFFKASELENTLTPLNR